MLNIIPNQKKDNMEKFKEKYDKFLEFVVSAHSGQKRKYTGEPYHNHLKRVSDEVLVLNPYAAFIGLGHDLIEDTDETKESIERYLHEVMDGDYLGIKFIIDGIICLTDEYTKEKYPNMNRSERKGMEIDRLTHMHPVYQSIKYADITDNISSIVEHDPDFGLVYVKEKIKLVNRMRYGDIDLMIKCFHMLHEARIKLEI